MNLGLVAMLAADDDGGGPDTMSENAIHVFKQLMRLRQGKRDGWLQFCSQIGVDPDAITARFIKGADLAREVAQAATETLREDDDGSLSAEEMAKREFEALTAAWNEAV